MSRPRKYSSPEVAVANVLERALANYGYGNRGRWIENLGELAVPLAEIRQQIIADLGGDSNVSEMKRHQIDNYLKTRLIIDTMDSVIFSMPSIINKSRRTPYGIVGERMKYAETLSRLADKIGLEIKQGGSDPLQEHILKKYGKKAAAAFSGGRQQQALETTAVDVTGEEGEEVAKGEGREDSPSSVGGAGESSPRLQASRIMRDSHAAAPVAVRKNRLRLPRRFPDDMPSDELSELLEGSDAFGGDYSEIDLDERLEEPLQARARDDDADEDADEEDAA